MINMNKKDSEKKLYVEFGNDSGCFLADYKYIQQGDDNVVVVQDINEKSGRFSSN